MLKRAWTSWLLCGSLMAAVVAVQAAVTHDPSLSWQTLHTRHFRIHFHDGGERMARRVAGVSESVHERLSPLIGWVPEDPVDIVIDGRKDITNGYASFFPSNRISIFVSPPDEINSVEDHDGWLEQLLTHEYVHILHLDRANGAPAVFRRIFGRNTWLFPNVLQPHWLIEGLATWHETDRERGVGRGQSSYFNMLMRMEVAGGVKPIRQINQPIATWPTGYVPYLYGVAFHDFIADRKGEERIHRLVDHMSDNLIPYRINGTARTALGGNYDQLWPEFESYLQERHGSRLDAIRQAGVVAGEQVSRDGYAGGISFALPDGDVVYLRADGRHEPALMRIGHDGVLRKLMRVNPGSRLSVNAKGRALLAQAEINRNSNVYYDLYAVDLGNGRCHRLTRAGRYHFGAWNLDGDRIAAVRADASGQNQLHLLDAKGKRVDVLWAGEPDVVLSAPSWSPDGSNLVMAVWRPDGGWNIERFRLAERQFDRLTNDGEIETHPVYTPDGRSLLYASDHGGVYNLRRLDFDTGQTVTLTNVEGGAFHPTQGRGGGPIYYTGNHPGGFDIFRLDQPASLPTPAASARRVSPRPVELPADIASAPAEAYSPWSGLRPRWWFPHLAFDSRRTEVGAMTSGWDVLQRHIYYLDAAYDFSNEWATGSFDYIYDRWDPVFKLHASRYSSVFLDQNDDPARVTTSDTFMGEILVPLVRSRRDLALRGAIYRVRDADGWLANGVLPVADRTDNVLGYALTYDSTTRYPRSISRSHGFQLSLSAETSDAWSESTYSGEVYVADIRAFVPLGYENVLALRGTYGFGSKQPRPFILGGSRSASTSPYPIDPALVSSPFNQREFSIRGYDSGEPGLVGRRMYTASAEWRFPVARIERGFMAPPVSLHQVFGSVFVDTGDAWQSGRSSDGRYTGVGLEVNAETFVFYDLAFHLRLGYAHGFADDGSNHAYLQLGSSF